MTTIKSKLICFNSEYLEIIGYSIDESIEFIVASGIEVIIPEYNLFDFNYKILYVNDEEY